MKLHDKIWLLKKDVGIDAEEMSKKLGISVTASKLLINRGIKTFEKAERFLNPRLEDLYNPFILENMDKAVLRVKEALESEDEIWIYGKYDVDGIMSISMLLFYFKSLGINANYYIPSDIVGEKHEINSKIINHIYSKKGSLIIGIDCIVQVEEINYAKSLGIDIILLDCDYEDNLPEDTIIINTKTNYYNYKYDILSSAGTTFKLISALNLSENSKYIYNNYLDMVALGTIADKVLIIGENRILVKYGLQMLFKTDKFGLRALLNICKSEDEEITVKKLIFILEQKLSKNILTEEIFLLINLLLSDDYNKAYKQVEKLYSNIERFELEKYDIKKCIDIDLELSVKEVNFELIEEIEKFKPFGPGNPKPIFLYRNLIVENFVFTGDNFKLIVQDESRIFDCIGHNLKKFIDKLNKKEKVDIVFYLEKKRFKGVETIQFNLHDLRRYDLSEYKNREILNQFYTSLSNIVYDFKFYIDKNQLGRIFDYRNIKNRHYLIDKKLSKGSNLILVNTFNALLELLFYLSDIGRYDIDDLLSFNFANDNLSNNIVVNPILNKIDLKKFENVIIYDIPLNRERFEYILCCGKNIYLLYNQFDIASTKKMLYNLIPDRSDLVKVYKCLKKVLGKSSELLFNDIYKEAELNLSKVKLCMDILERAGLIKIYECNNKVNLEILPPPSEKIDIESTDLYKRAYDLKEKFEKYKNIAFANNVLKT
ncbi:hypothetical protein SAMN02745883_00426 [Caminicella sporogenes DSM 14501]|uniref:Uncharacterized protein n=1 Tax=Caminicella sporogenes DSM 14501 TaxID=1121266 RepID=A0A1M6M0V7_9FIRM|nr:DHH family phosphoesterase [Caminicella sporogenes]RKD28020.1 hypothetical protein BET04_02890 [Caminicella sporogenes]SHJ77058.1 hypothetical protein SAMN02745883_00426 [Caminicella sporogenes DSM 14501]